MAGKIIAMISCLYCAIPFFVVGRFNKDSREPIGFWSGDSSLKEKVKDIKNFNHEMARLYQKCAWFFVATGILFLVWTPVGIALLIFDCTLGIYLVYRCYKSILEKNS